MAYIGKVRAAVALTSSDITDSIITQAKMADDAIALAELKAGTDGELITWDTSGDPAAVGAGTSGHFLKSQGAGSVPVFAAAAAGRVLIKEIDASDVAAVTFVHGTSDVVFDTTYDKYELSWSNVKVGADEQLNLRALSGGSVLTSGYYSQNYGVTDGSAGQDQASTYLLETIGDLDAGEPFFGVAYFYNVGVSSSKPSCYGQYFHQRSTGTRNSRGFTGLYDTAISDFDGVTMTDLGGPNIASGKFKLYGIT